MAAFVHRFRTRYHECDPQGVVFNANHITYVDVGFTEMMRSAFGSFSGVTDLGLDAVVADVHASFRAPVGFDADVELSLTIARFGRSSMTTKWQTVADDRVCVEGEIVHVWIDPATSQPIEIPAEVREGLAQFTG